MSFLASVREELYHLPLRKKCCRKNILHGILFARGDITGQEISVSLDKTAAEYTIPLLREFVGREADASVRARQVRLCFASASLSKYLEGCAEGEAPCAPGCPECHASFLRGVFLGCARVEDPSKTYRMEFLPSHTERVLPVLQEVLDGKLIPTVRRGASLLLLRDSGYMEDFLIRIGAKDSAFRLMNSKIEHQLKEDANRIANCEANNIGKTVQKASEQLYVIQELQKEGLFSSLPTELEEVASLRLAYPELSISQLCLKFPYPISKSGMNHRLNKLLKSANELLRQKRVQKEV